MYKMDCTESRDCIEYIKRAIQVEAVKYKTYRSADDAVGSRLSQLPLQDRNNLITLLTHTGPPGAEGNEMNTDLLTFFPSLEKRSQKLLEFKQRKCREDKIDTSFISDFMHDYCRYYFFAYAFSL